MVIWTDEKSTNIHKNNIENQEWINIPRLQRFLSFLLLDESPEKIKEQN